MMMIGAVQCKIPDNHFDRILSPQYSNQIAGHSYFNAAQATSSHAMTRDLVSPDRERNLVYTAVDDDQNHKLLMIVLYNAECSKLI